MKKILSIFFLFIPILFGFSTFQKIFGEDSKIVIVGTWKLFEKIPNGDFSSPDYEISFHEDGTVTETMTGASEVAKWKSIDDEIVALTINKKTSYLVFHDYKNGASGPRKSGYYNGKVLNGLYMRYSEGSPYYDFLKIIYIAKGDDIDRKNKSIWGISDKEKKKMIYDSISFGNVATKELSKLLAVQDAIAKENEDREKMQQKHDEKYAKDLEKKWGKKTAQAILNKDVFIGMTTEQVIESMGEPQNRTTIETAKGKLEQWTYLEGRTLLMLNGKVNAIQRENE